MFDQYSTVVDIQGGLIDAATPYLRSKGWLGNPHSFVTWWRRTHFENSMIDALLHRDHTSYREIGHRSVDFVLERAGIDHSMDEVYALVSEIEKLRCFPEVPAALARLQSSSWCCRTAIRTCSRRPKHTRDPLRHGVSGAQANTFKPHVAAYTKAAEIADVRRDQVLFVANHTFDCVGAKAAGMHTAFIDRRQRPFGITPYQPDIRVRSMTELADLLS